MRGFWTPDVRSLPRGYKPLDINDDILNEFLKTYPEFDQESFPRPMVVAALEDADVETGSAWGKYHSKRVRHSLKKRGMFSWAAHWLAFRSTQIASAKGGDGVASAAFMYPTTSESVGDESISFGVPAVTTEDQANNGTLNLTPYGIEFLRLRNRATAGAWMV
ncbi:hypothetical protein R84981_002890 [Carnimonas sp. R-84981]|uniref:DUF4054 domain-containing protein n=1 Tax=Carnimonas bestiolae TaxID=3402172 RepID=UPI003EDC8D90